MSSFLRPREVSSTCRGINQPGIFLFCCGLRVGLFGFFWLLWEGVVSLFCVVVRYSHLDC